jgi:hypothetical protein
LVAAVVHGTVARSRVRDRDGSGTVTVATEVRDVQGVRAGVDRDQGFMASKESYPVRFVETAPGVVRVMHLDAGHCNGRAEATLHFVRVRAGVRITAVDPAGCSTDPNIASQLAGTVLTWYPVPARAQ